MPVPPDRKRRYLRARLCLAAGGGWHPHRVLQEKAEVLELVGRWPEAEAVHRMQQGWAEQLRDDELLAEAFGRQGIIKWKAGDYRQALELLEALLVLSRRFNLRRYIGLALNNIGLVHMNRGSHELARAHFLEDLAICRELGDAQNLCHVHGNLGLVCMNQGQYEEAREHFGRQRALAAGAGLKQQVGHALCNLGIIEMYQANHDAALVLFQQYLAISRSIGDKKGVATALGNMGIIHWNLCRLEQSQDCLEQQVRISRELGDQYSISYGIGNMAVICLARGRLDQADENARQQLSLAMEQGNIQGQCLALGNLGNIGEARGEDALAQEHYQQQLALAARINDRRNQAQALTSLGRLFTRINQPDSAEILLNQARDISRGLQEKGSLAEIELSLAELYAETGRAQQAGETVIAALTLAGESQNREAVFGCRLLQARLTAAADPAAAEASLMALGEAHHEDSCLARIFYHLHRLTRRDEYRRQALSWYHKLHQRLPYAEYRRRIGELSDPGVPSAAASDRSPP